MHQTASVVPVPAGNTASMRAHMLIRPGEISFVDIPRPVPGAGDIVLRVRAGRALITGVYPLAELVHALHEHQRGEGIKFAVIP